MLRRRSRRRGIKRGDQGRLIQGQYGVNLHHSTMSAPSRASGFFLSSTAAFTASITPNPLSDPMPMPFTAPEMPKAAPRCRGAN